MGCGPWYSSSGTNTTYTKTSTGGANFVCNYPFYVTANGVSSWRNSAGYMYAFKGDDGVTYEFPAASPPGC